MKRVMYASAVLFLIAMNVLAGPSAPRATRQIAETFSGLQIVRKSPVQGSGVPESQLVTQPHEIRTWSYVYLFQNGTQLNEFVSIDIRKRKDNGQQLKKICNHYRNPVRLGQNKFTYTVFDVGKAYDPSCDDTTPPIGPRRVVIEWKSQGGIQVVDRMIWSNFVAGASGNMMIYVDFERSPNGRSITADIVFPAHDQSTNVLEARHAVMHL